jgi:hypothetical protein
VTAFRIFLAVLAFRHVDLARARYEGNRVDCEVYGAAVALFSRRVAWMESERGGSFQVSSHEVSQMVALTLVNWHSDCHSFVPGYNCWRAMRTRGTCLRKKCRQNKRSCHSIVPIAALRFIFF